jgi:hypothetical protein
MLLRKMGFLTRDNPLNSGLLKRVERFFLFRAGRPYRRSEGRP